MHWGLWTGKGWEKLVYRPPGTFFVPTLAFSIPEGWHYANFPEYMTRDVQPFPGYGEITTVTVTPETGIPLKSG
jgi:hypothetical protein